MSHITRGRKDDDFDMEDDLRKEPLDRANDRIAALETELAALKRIGCTGSMCSCGRAVSLAIQLGSADQRIADLESALQSVLIDAGAFERAKQTPILNADVLACIRNLMANTPTRHN